MKHCVSNAETLRANVTAMHSYAAAKLSQTVAHPGRKSMKSLEERAEEEEDVRSLADVVTAVTELTAELDVALTKDEPEATSFKRTYYSNIGRSRAHVTGPGAQKLPVWAQELLFGEADDYDLVCAIVKLIVAILRRVIVTSNYAECDFTSMKEVAADRCKVCEEKLGMSEFGGKEVINSIITGKKWFPPDVMDKAFVKKLSREAQVLRWLAVSLRPDVYTTSLEEGTRCPENMALLKITSSGQYRQSSCRPRPSTSRCTSPASDISQTLPRLRPRSQQRCSRTRF